MLKIERPWRKQPQGVVSPSDWALSRGVRALFLPQPNGVIFEAVTRRMPDSFVATPVIRPRGIHSRMSSSAATAQFNTVFGMPQSGITIVAFLRNTSTIGFDSGALIKVGSSTTGYGIGVGSNSSGSWDNVSESQNLTALYEAVAWKLPSPVVTIASAGTEYYCAALRINSDRTGGIFAPNIGAGTWSASSIVTPASNTYIGGYQANRYPEEHELLAAALFASVLSNAEITGLSANPWQLFAPQQIYIPSSAAPTLPTLSAATFTDRTTTSLRPRVTYTFP